MKGTRIQTLILSTIFSVFLTSGCSWFQDEENVVAEYNGKYLMRDELGALLPPTTSKADSALMAQVFIDDWLRSNAILDAAGDDAPELNALVERQVEDFRNKLIRKLYIDKLLRKRLDTIVTEEDYKSYYSEASDRFKSMENLYKYFYVRTFSQETGKLGKWMRSDDPADRAALEEWCRTNATVYKIDTSYVGEYELDEVNKGYFGNLRNVPRNSVIKWFGTQDGKNAFYFFVMKNTIASGTPLPITLTHEVLKQQILAARKAELIELIEQEILNEKKDKMYIH